MKLIDLTCPKCGASIKADPSKETYTCEYCDSILFIDRETGKSEEKPHKAEAEKPKTEQDPMEKERKKILKSLAEARTVIAKAEQVYSDYANKKFKADMIFKASKLTTIGGGFLVGCVISLPAIMIFGSFISPITILVVLCVFFPIYFTIRNKKQLEQKAVLQEQCGILMNKLVDLERQAVNIADIPSDYRYCAVIDRLSRCIGSKKANSIEEAIAVYENETSMLKTSNPMEAKTRELEKNDYIRLKQAVETYGIGSM